MSKHHSEKKGNEQNLPDFEHFLSRGEIEIHDKVHVTKVSFSRRTKIAFWFLRIYIAMMIILVIVGFTRV